MQIFTSSISTTWIIKGEIPQAILYRLAFKHVLNPEQAYVNSVLVKATLLYLFKASFHSQGSHLFMDLKTRGTHLICAFKSWKWHRYMIHLWCCKIMCSYTEMPYYLRKYFSVWEECAILAQKYNYALSFLLCTSTEFAGEWLFSAVVCFLEVISLHIFRHLKKNPQQGIQFSQWYLMNTKNAKSNA